jgi:predicted nucleic acid-binding protein
MKQRIYIDTSVVGGYFDKEFSDNTVPFFDSIKRGERIIIVFDLLVAELLTGVLKIQFSALHRFCKILIY